MNSYPKFNNKEELLSEIKKIQDYLLDIYIIGKQSGQHFQAINSIGIIGLNVENDLKIEFDSLKED